MIPKQNILILAGEESGDMLGANLISCLRATRPDLRIYAFGGLRMKEAGAQLLFNTLDTAVVGVFEVLKALPKLLALEKKILSWVVTNLPRAILLIDYPGFHLRLLPRLAGLVPVYWYIPPKVWVWKPGRAALLEKLCKKVYTIFPFEKTWFPQKGAYFGHPLIDSTKPALDRDEFLKSLGLDPKSRVIALMPGSRKQEISRMLPEFLKAARTLKSKFPDLEFILPRPNSVSESMYRLDGYPVKMICGNSVEVMHSAQIVLATSGTVTLEAAILRKPMVICYQVNWLTYLAFQHLSSVSWVGLPNILAGKEICPELLQKNMQAEKIVEVVSGLIREPKRLQAQIENLHTIVASLGEDGVNQRIAGDLAESLGR
ncbi:MAG: lipid-A-disaccharide synthase [Candidatus Cloacimonetes bacterium]|nr:lipid-A-disaccharide synthase [Candidatus Cloacimonadota bacterium]